MISLFVTVALTFSPGDKILWGDKITNASNKELNNTFSCSGLVIKQDHKLLHVKGTCNVALGEDTDNRMVYIPMQIDDYITTEEVKGRE